MAKSKSDTTPVRTTAKPTGPSPWFGRARFIIGLLALLGIMVASRLHVAFSPCVFLRLGPLTLACPLGTLEVSLAGHAVIWNLLPGFIMLGLLAFILGRMWCGWVCPASLAGSALGGTCSFLLPGPAKSVKNGWRRAAAKLSARFSPKRAHMLGFLTGLLIGAYVFRYPLWSIICPLGVVSRNLIQGSIFLLPRLDVLFLLLPLLAMLFWRSGWKCACPVGLVHGLASHANRTLIPLPSLADKRPCNKCGLCRKICPAGLDPTDERIDAFACIKCLRCVAVCPRRAMRLRLLPNQHKAGKDGTAT